MLKKLLILNGLLILLVGCAHIVAPNGGNKDLTPPTVLHTQPNNFQTNFDTKKIVIKFNEYIQLTNPDDQVIISPPLNNKPTYTIKGKLLEIKILDTLNAQTTYTINFGNALGDNHENNILQNYKYVFCTGNVIDTAFISGTVINAFNSKPATGITVALYQQSNYTDSTPYKERPIYLTKSNETGLFNITNLPYSRFNIFAFKDDNKNNKADPLEEVAFTNSLIAAADSSSDKVKLLLFSPDVFTHGKIVDTFLREPDKITLVSYKTTSAKFKNINNNQVYVKANTLFPKIDTFLIFTKSNNDSLFNINATINNINHLFKVSTKPTFKAQPLLLTTSNQLDLEDTLILSFNNPIISFDTARIKLIQDSTQLTYYYKKVDDFTLQIIFNWQEKTNYTIDIQDSAFIDFYKQYNSSKKNSYTIKAIKDYGSLVLHFKTPGIHNNYIIQLVDMDDKNTNYQYFINHDTTVNIKYIIPGTYKVKIITDTNLNNHWDNGEVFKHLLPETVTYYSEPLLVKAYWDLEQRIIIE